MWLPILAQDQVKTFRPSPDVAQLSEYQAMISSVMTLGPAQVPNIRVVEPYRFEGYFLLNRLKGRWENGPKPTLSFINGKVKSKLQNTDPIFSFFVQNSPSDPTGPSPSMARDMLVWPFKDRQFINIQGTWTSTLINGIPVNPLDLLTGSVVIVNARTTSQVELVGEESLKKIRCLRFTEKADLRYGNDLRLNVNATYWLNKVTYATERMEMAITQPVPSSWIRIDKLEMKAWRMR